MAYVPRTAGVRLVQVRAVEGGFPFYGEITTDPAGLWRELAGGDGALVDPALLAALGARTGDTLALGNARLPILGTVLNVPATWGGGGVPARVFIPAGPRAHRAPPFRLAPSTAFSGFPRVSPRIREVPPAAPAEQVGRTIETTGESVRRALPHRAITSGWWR
jgi:hypothetical protein